MIRALLHLPGDGFSQPVDIAGEGAPPRDKRSVLWVDVQDPTPGDVDLLRREFHFHELALEDATRPHQRPKMEEYESFYFLVFYSARLDAKGLTVQLTELDLFIGENHVVAVHRGPLKEIDDGLKRWERNHAVVGHSAGTLVYSLLDALVDGYFDVVDAIAEQVATLEEQIVRGSERDAVQPIFELKKRLLALRRILAPERDALNALMRQDLPLFDAGATVYFRDVYDHLVRIIDTVDLQSDLLTSAVDVYLSSVSNRLNQVMKTLTSVTIILMTVALIAGIYGMNFKNMPELEWELGYPWAIGLMAVSGVGLYVYLRRKGWL